MYDVIIVGGGPGGLSAALILARCHREIVVIDAGHPRNECTDRLHGYLTRDGISPRELRTLGRLDVARYGAEIISDKAIRAACILSTVADPPATTFRIETASGRIISSRKLLLATGIVDVLPDIPGINDCFGKSIHHCPYCDGWEYRNQHLLAIGSAHKVVSLALSLRTWSNHVTAMSNGSILADEDREHLCREGVAVSECRIEGIRHSGGKMFSVELANGQFVNAAAAFVTVEQIQRSDLAEQLGLTDEISERPKTKAKHRSHIPGLFVLGDSDGHIQFAIVAAAEGATAAVAINHELQNERVGGSGSLLQV